MAAKAEHLGHATDCQCLRCCEIREYLRKLAEPIVLALLSKMHAHTLAMYETVPEQEVVLSERELECLDLWGQGMTSTEVAKEMGIKLPSVCKYGTTIRKKLGMKNMNQVYAHAVRHRMLTTSDGAMDSSRLDFILNKAAYLELRKSSDGKSQVCRLVQKEITGTILELSGWCDAPRQAVDEAMLGRW